MKSIKHTVNSGSEMVETKHVSGKNIFWSTLTAKSRKGKFFEFLHCPFEGRANMHHKIQPNWLTGRCCLAGGSKGQCRKSKIFLSLLLPMKVDQYIFFPETCFASTISEPEFTVWFVIEWYIVDLHSPLLSKKSIDKKNCKNFGAKNCI